MSEKYQAVIDKLDTEATNPELGGKMRAALGKVVGGMSERVGGVQG